MNGKYSWFSLMTLCVLLLHQQGRAQVSDDVQRQYTTAVKLIKAGDYERAKVSLNPIIQQRGPLAPYANYYYALAAFQQKNYPQARGSVRQLMEVFPNWRKMDEANYLLSAINMETGQYEEAFTILSRISDSALRTDVAKLEQSFLQRITDLNRLKKLNQAFPGDRNIGLALIDLIQRSSSDKDDLELSDRLTNRFGVPGTVSTQTTPPAGGSSTGRPNPATTPTNRNSRQKGYYNVAVMFPFRLDEFDAEKRVRSNQYVYDLYNGIKLAKAKLQEEGITVNLFAYDVDNDANKTLELLNSPAFAQTDLIIGPLYVEPNRIASAYASQNNILLLNPIATSRELVATQPMSFLAQPSVNQQAKKAAELTEEFGNGRRAAIYFGTARKDSLLASAYLAELKRQNYQIADFKKISGNAQTMASAMQFTGLATTAPRSASVATPPAPMALSHVFFASSNEDDGGRMLDALSRRRISGPLVATASAFNFYRNSLSTFTRRELYLLYPDFVDSSREPVITFEEQYVAKRNTIPSIFASEGYDMMLFFGRQLAKNGTQLRNRSGFRSDTDDYLLSGFDYTQSNENQIVPIVKYEDGRFIKIN